MEIVSSATALSPAVRRLICDIGCQINETEGDGIECEENESRSGACSGCVVSIGELRSDEIASSLPAPDNTTEYFEQAVAALAPVFAQCQHAVCCNSNSGMEGRLLLKLWWTCSEKVFVDSLDMMKKSQIGGPENILALLLMSAVLERSLGNVYLLKGSQCPSMLKDLLVTDELADTLGGSVIQILRIVMGPPISLNLRNVAWHGFLGDEELSNRYCCFLVFLAASIGDILSSKGIDSVPQRIPCSWTSDVQSQMLKTSPGLKDKTNLQTIKDLLVTSSLIQPQTEKQWQLVFNLYYNDRYGYCLALLLPLLEHCLRRVFATVNGCPGRVLTAESSALYTTFNEMLEKMLPEGTTNKLPEFLTPPCMDLLQDLLFYPDGPRIRDHLSHGEVDFEAVDEKFVYPFLSFAVFLAHHLHPDLPAFENFVIQDMMQKVQTYRSVFHPVATLQCKYGGLLSMLKKTGGYVQVSADLEPLEEHEGASKLCENNDLLMRTKSEVADLWQLGSWTKTCPVSINDLSDCFSLTLDPLQRLSQKDIPTLFRWQFEGDTDKAGTMKESEFVGLLLRITEECTNAIEQIQHTLLLRQKQLAEKALRSRQRDNLKKLLICVPCLQLLLAWIATLLGWNIQLLDSFSSLEPTSCRMLQRQLKQILQHCENVRTYTASDKNKWTESVQLLLALIPKCHDFFVQWDKASL